MTERSEQHATPAGARRRRRRAPAAERPALVPEVDGPAPPDAWRYRWETWSPTRPANHLVMVELPDGRPEGFVAATPDDVSGKSEAEVQAEVDHYLERLRATERFLSRESIAHLSEDLNLLDALAEHVAAEVVTVIAQTYRERARREGDAGGTTDDTLRAGARTAAARIKRSVYAQLARDPTEEARVQDYFWRHHFSELLQELEEQLRAQGRTGTVTITPAEFHTAMARLVRDVDVPQAVNRLLPPYGAALATGFLSAMELEARPLIDLAELLGFTGPGEGDGLAVREPVGPRYLPTNLPQQTFPEAKALAIGMADGPQLRRWRPVEGEVALRHKVDGAALETKLTGGPLLDWLGMPNTVDSLREELRQAGLPSVLLLHTVLGASLERAEKNRLYVTVAVDDLITAIGWKPRSALERDRRRRQVWRWLAILDSCQVVGRRPGKYRDPDTRQEIDLTSLDALIRITGQRKPAQLAFDASVPPLEVTYAAGPWIEQWRGKRHILTYFGNVRKLAAIPAGKPSGAWAQAVGLALFQRWRERSAYAQVAHVGDDKHLTVRMGTFTRRELLDTFPPQPTADEVLRGDHPQRAREYWRDAITLLKQQQVIGFYKEIGRFEDKRKGWQGAWLDQELDVRPTEEGQTAAAEIAQRAQPLRRARTVRRGLTRGARRPGTVPLPLDDVS